MRQFECRKSNKEDEMKRAVLKVLVGSVVAINAIAGVYTLDIKKGWNFLGAKKDIVAEEIAKDGNVTEILAFENGKWITWKAGEKNNELKVIFAGSGFLVNSKNDTKVEVTALNDEIVTFQNGKVIFQIPFDDVKKLYIDDEPFDASKEKDIKIEKKDRERFTIAISPKSALEGVHNFMIETKDGVKISKDLEIEFSRTKASRYWSFSTFYGYCGTRSTKSLSKIKQLLYKSTKYASDWAVDLYHSGKGDVYFGEACRRHDECYTGQWGRKYCDERLYHDLKYECRKVYGYEPKTWREKASLGACLYKAWVYYQLVRMGGDDAYKEAAR